MLIAHNAHKAAEQARPERRIMATATNSVDETSAPVTQPRSVLKWLGVLGALTAIGLILALFALRQPAKSYPKGSPEHAVAAYLEYLQQGNVDRAYSMTSFPPSGIPGDPRSNFHQQWDGWSARSHRVTVVHTSRFGNGASVTVDVEAFSGGPLGASDTSNRATFTLRHEHGSWRIGGPLFAYLP
jgi:hypothetical protein